jgi:GR25 family glycosyltransferase involved in LPS biosynthesis
MEKYVINLERRTDRLTSINLPFEYNVFKATDGKETYPDHKVKHQGFLGCLDSHRRLFQMAKDNNIETLLVMEDDIEVDQNFNDKLQVVLSELPEDWDLLYLGGWNVGEKEKYSQHLDRATKVYTTHAFIVRGKFFDTLLEGINSRDWKVDVLISEILPKGNCFICDPTIAWQKEGFSDIENKITNNVHLKK